MVGGGFDRFVPATDAVSLTRERIQHDVQLQRLIDMVFEVTMRAEEVCEMDREARAAWVAKHLKSMGFPTEPRGLSWGILIKETEF